MVYEIVRLFDPWFMHYCESYCDVQMTLTAAQTDPYEGVITPFKELPFILTSKFLLNFPLPLRTFFDVFSDAGECIYYIDTAVNQTIQPADLNRHSF